MKFFLLFFCSLVFTQTYAVCTYQTTASLPIPVQTITNLPQTVLYTTAVTQNIVSCTTQINIRSEFIPNSTVLSATVPFSLANINSFQITGGGSGLSDSTILAAAKNYILQNLRIISLQLKDNNTVTAVAAKSITNSSTTYNILPDTGSSTFTTENNGETYYRGTSGVGVTSYGIRLSQVSFSLASPLPSASVMDALQNATISIPIGTLRTKDYPTDNATNITTTNSAVTLSFTLNFSLPTCTVNVPSTLDLGSTTIATLENNGFSNSTSFPLSINCSAAIPNRTFKLTIEDANDIANINTTGILKNLPAIGNASNAAIRLMNSSTPFPIGTQFNYSSSGTATSQILFNYTPSAQIIRTVSPVTLGNIAGKARFLVDYE